MANWPHVVDRSRLLRTVAALLLASCGGGSEPTVAPAPATPAAAELEASPAIEVELCVKVTPAGATVTIEGEVVTAPCTTVEGDEGTSVTVEVSSEGHVSRSVEVNLDEVLEPIEISLEPDSAPAPPQAPGEPSP